MVIDWVVSKNLVPLRGFMIELVFDVVQKQKKLDRNIKNFALVAFCPCLESSEKQSWHTQCKVD